jgi:hypothetical protein
MDTFHPEKLKYHVVVVAALEETVSKVRCVVRNLNPA